MTEEIGAARKQQRQGAAKKAEKRVREGLEAMRKASKSVPGRTKKQVERARRTSLAESRARRRGR